MQEDLQDAAEWESDEELDGMGCPPGWSSQLEGQGSSLVPGPGEMSLKDQSTATSQVESAPAMKFTEASGQGNGLLAQCSNGCSL